MKRGIRVGCRQCDFGNDVETDPDQPTFSTPIEEMEALDAAVDACKAHSEETGHDCLLTEVREGKPSVHFLLPSKHRNAFQEGEETPSLSEYRIKEEDL